MLNQVQIFKNKDFGEIEILTVEEKQYFPATECARILGYNQPEHAVNRHCLNDGCMKRTVIDKLGREQEMKFISEGNLYRLIIRSKLPAAVKFEKWVFDDVLPSIRKYGSYITSEMLEEILSNPEFAIKYFTMLKAERDKCKTLSEQIEVLAPKARYYDVILQCSTAIPVSVIAKDYGMTAVAFNKLLNSFGVQYKIGGTWLLYKEHLDKQYTVSKTYHIQDRAAAIHTYWTQRGRKFLYELLKQHGILPEIERTGGV